MFLILKKLDRKHFGERETLKLLVRLKLEIERARVRSNHIHVIEQRDQREIGNYTSESMHTDYVQIFFFLLSEQLSQVTLIQPLIWHHTSSATVYAQHSSQQIFQDKNQCYHTWLHRQGMLCREQTPVCIATATKYCIFCFAILELNSHGD